MNMEPPTGPAANAEITGELLGYHAYLLRLWKEQRSGQAVWRASLEDPHTGERLGFAGLPQLFEFLEGQACSQAAGH